VPLEDPRGDKDDNKIRRELAKKKPVADPTAAATAAVQALQVKPEDSPFTSYEARMEAVFKAVQGFGFDLIKGIEKGDGDEEEEEEEDEDEEEDGDVDRDKLTAEQVATLRHIVITLGRDQAQRRMRKLVLGAQADRGFLSFNTSFSYELTAKFEAFTRYYKSLKDWSDKFDNLLAFTMTIDEFDVWYVSSL
jgi:hypothetical protein